ncbi:O-antigen ligase family protein [Paraflavitalea speifideaquila]|uniref:O-antigen ligase family protein n=1 Tax=Paraflavitalea speifideaquila TaxID=3076558 RepID=UPI0028E196FD|nr:O-antigen ligase family protein [Paraflavitalea speifideiaquila]
MKKWHQLRAFVRQYEQPIYTYLCIGIAYTLVFWTLLNSLLCIALAGFWLLFGRKNKEIAGTRKGFILLFTSLYLMAVAGLLYTTNMKEGMTILQQKSALLLFPVIFGTTQFLTSQTTRAILLHFLIATSLASGTGFIYGLVKAIMSRNIKMLTNENLILFPDIYPYVMGIFCLLSIIILFQLLPSFSKNKQRLLYFLAIFLSLIIILLSIRLVIACWFIIILLMTFKNYIKGLYARLAVILFLVAILIGSFITIPSLQAQWKDLKDFSTTNTIQLDQDASLGKSWGGKAIRLAIWKCSKDLIQKHWLAGVGTGDVQDSLQVAYEDRQFYFASRYNRYNTHNQYLQAWLTNGIVGLVLLILCIFIPFTFYKKRHLTKCISSFFFILRHLLYRSHFRS